MSYNTKNYTEQGGAKTVIGGEIVIAAGGTLTAEDGSTVPAITTAATATVLGGVKAATKGAGDTVECKIDGTSKKLYVAPPAAATTSAAGIVKQAANVAEAAGAAPTAAEFKALLDALIAAGIMAAGA